MTTIYTGQNGLLPLPLSPLPPEHENSSISGYPLDETLLSQRKSLSSSSTDAGFEVLKVSKVGSNCFLGLCCCLFVCCCCCSHGTYSHLLCTPPERKAAPPTSSLFSRPPFHPHHDEQIPFRQRLFQVRHGHEQRSLRQVDRDQRH